jgi:spermidine synthase
LGHEKFAGRSWQNRQSNLKAKPTAPASVTPLSAGLRRYLYFSAATTGAAIMIVEILGAKMLAPYFGTSHFVWTAQIAVTLVALATGYYAGGRLVDRSPQLSRLYWAVLLAAVYLSLTVLVVEPAVWWCLDFNLAVGSLLASTLLFFVPLALLAMAGPFFIRVLTVAVTGVGGNVGRLTAVSTLGSFAGTVLIGYVCIPFLPNSITMYATSGAVMAVAAGYFFGWGRKRNSAAPVVCGIIFALLLGGIGVAMDQQPARGEGWHEVYRANSNFGRLQVIDTHEGAYRYYLNDGLDQNDYDPRVKKALSAFSYMLHGLARGYTMNIEKVLCIGLGVGIVPMKFAQEGVRVDVVEINPAVVPLAARFFNLEPARFNLAIDDGRHFVNRTAQRYDAIILDAFLGDSSPSHLMSREAFAAMRRILKPGGVLVINAFGETGQGKDFFAASLDKTLKAVFHSVRIHGADKDNIGNLFFVASDQPEMTMRSSPNFSEVHESCRQKVQDACATILKTDPAHGLVLTDDYNPVEYYDAANREQIRRNLVMATRQQ